MAGRGLPPTADWRAGDAPALRVLVIEEDERAREELCSILSSAGISATGTADTQEAFALAALVQPAVALISWSAQLGGLTPVRTLINAHGMAGRIVMVSTQTDPRDRRAAMEAGVSHYLLKPPQRDLVLDAVKKAAMAGRPADAEPERLLPQRGHQWPARVMRVVARRIG